jgi:hypothetical protein
MDAHERLTAAMPGVDELDARRRWPWDLPHRPFEVRWRHEPDGPPTFACRELSRGPADACWLGFYNSTYEGRHGVFLRVWAGEPPERQPLPATAARPWFAQVIDEGDCDTGRVWLSHYVEGADLNEVRRAGVELSWLAACCVHAAARAPLAMLHAREIMHGALSPSRIRFALFPEPYTGAAAPLRLCAPLCGIGGAVAAACEIAELAAAVCTLTRHPDPQIDALLRDPSPHALPVLTDLLLERDAPVPELLADRLRGSEAAAAALVVEPYADADTIQPELETLWRRVMELCIVMR